MTDSKGFARQLVVRFGAGALVLAVVFFGTAGTLRYWQALLCDELPGYREYVAKTRYRLIPGVW